MIAYELRLRTRGSALASRTVRVESKIIIFIRRSGYSSRKSQPQSCAITPKRARNAEISQPSVALIAPEQSEVDLAARSEACHCLRAPKRNARRPSCRHR